jgi:hypothetical protein
VLKWNPVNTDSAAGREVVTTYQIHRSTVSGFTPSSSTLLTTVGAPTFGTTDGKVTYTDSGAAGKGYYYKIVPVNAAGKNP